MVRDKDNYILHGAGLLFQQYIVDAYVRAEGQRLFYLRSHQAELRSESYKELTDTINSPEYRPGMPLGKRIVLPSSYPGSPRAMQQNYLDAMSMVRNKGKPDFFVTMTANPQWQEITENLLPAPMTNPT